MAQVNLTVNGRIYRMACEDGEEEHVAELGERFDAAINELRGVLGEIGDQRLMVMAGILMTDRLGDTEERLKRAEQDVQSLKDGRADTAMRIDGLAQNFAESLNRAAARIERIAERLQGAPGRTSGRRRLAPDAAALRRIRRYCVTRSAYNDELPRSAANYQPLTPLVFLERSARDFPRSSGDRAWRASARAMREFYTPRAAGSHRRWRSAGSGSATRSRSCSRTRRRCSKRITACRCSARCLHAINTRLDAALIAFQLEHSESKVVIVDREFSGVMAEALGKRAAKPLVIDFDDPEYPADAPAKKGARDRHARLRGADRGGRPRFRMADAGRRMGRDQPELYVGHHRQSEGRRLPPSRRGADVLRERARRRHGAASRLSLDAADVPLQRLVLSRGRSPPSPARMCASDGCAPRRSSRRSPSIA